MLHFLKVAAIQMLHFLNVDKFINAKVFESLISAAFYMVSHRKLKWGLTTCSVAPVKAWSG